MGRFINADVFASTGQGFLGFNMFAYCCNNPVIFADHTGNAAHLIIQVAVNDGGGGGCSGHTGVDQALHAAVNGLDANGIDTASIGAGLLGFYESTPGIYHARTVCWQMLFGYNKLYDYVFDIGTCMDVAIFPFEADGTSYVLWAWKGDYLNLGAGAELGIYCGSGPHHFVNPFLSMPMSMSLNYGGSSIISHSQTTWWITGFNSYYKNIHASHLTATYTVNFSSFPEIYNGFYARYYGTPGWQFNSSNYSATFTF